MSRYQSGRNVRGVIIGGQFVPVRLMPRQRVQKHAADYSTRFQPRYHAGERPCYRCANSQHTLSASRLLIS